MGKLYYMIKGENNSMYCQFENFSDLEDMCKIYNIHFFGKDKEKEIWGNPQNGNMYSVILMGA